MKMLSILFTGALIAGCALIATSLHAAANDPKGGARDNSLSAKDHAFVTQALQSGQEEIAMAQLARFCASCAMAISS